MMKFKIVPINEVAMEVEANTPDEAMMYFATYMDLDMSRYFKAVPAKKRRRITGYRTEF